LGGSRAFIHTQLGAISVALIPATMSIESRNEKRANRRASTIGYRTPASPVPARMTPIAVERRFANQCPAIAVHGE
jgi:hypothetical protein